MNNGQNSIMRNKNIDILKGVLILYVICYHFVWNGMALKSSPSALFFQTVCMQLFFFISGYLSYKDSNNYLNTSKSAVSFITKKAQYILIPTALMFSFSIFYFNTTFKLGLMDIHKNGYWFTLILFICFVLFAIILKPLEKISRNKWIDVVVVILSFIMMIASLVTGKVIDKDLAHTLSIPLFLKYWFFFILGYYSSKYKSIFGQIIGNKYVRILLLVVASTPLSLISEGIVRYFLECIVSPVRVIVIFNLFMDANFGDSFFVKELSRFGRHSLEIYFLQFYFIFGMPDVVNLINEQQEIIIWKGTGATLPIELIIVIPLAVAVAYLCIITRRAINFAPPISKLFFGQIPNE